MEKYYCGIKTYGTAPVLPITVH